ncbi:hypothetical protein SASPL_116203 [Salvia splendens]|uniref:Uncharacterized protein n=1 Tax=Salvia splendens TaxID=180675 RepID=A0A8X8XVP8_SALSN|nr:hypothetical protein SASPL_116203 [Salvia splendens]
MSMWSADVANKQHLDGVKKIAKLEAECQRLRGLVRKKLPGPATLAQMKLEVVTIMETPVYGGLQRDLLLHTCLEKDLAENWHSVIHLLDKQLIALHPQSE